MSALQHLDAFPKSKRPKGPPGYEDARALSVVVCLEPCEAGGEFEVVRGSAPAMLPSGVVRANAPSPHTCIISAQPIHQSGLTGAG